MGSCAVCIVYPGLRYSCFVLRDSVYIAILDPLAAKTYRTEK